MRGPGYGEQQAGGPGYGQQPTGGPGYREQPAGGGPGYGDASAGPGYAERPGPGFDEQRDLGEADSTQQVSPQADAGGRHVMSEPDVMSQPGGSADRGTRGSEEAGGLLGDVGRLRDEWQRVQATFVDDPQRAVQEAGALVDRMLEEIRANVTRRPGGGQQSTEDLRGDFQRYREFFQRLLSA